jgi:hypothetical protein
MTAVRTSVVASCVAAASIALGAQAPATPALAEAGAVCAQVWVTREADYEEFLKTAAVVSMKAVPVGVTRPSRAFFTAGGLAESMAWKPITPGLKGGFYESYRSEIAAYELDKLLGLQMVPPTVERRVQNETGAAVLWAAPTRSFKELGGVPGQANRAGPPAARAAAWTRQLVRAKMFDNLIANKDPNLGNWLVDGDWHLVLIDHSRSFTPIKTLVHKMDNVDRALWDKFRELTEARLQPTVGPWVGRNELRAILERRDRMQVEIDRMVSRRGAAVFLQ